jgi:hypothetical protein
MWREDSADADTAAEEVGDAAAVACFTASRVRWSNHACAANTRECFAVREKERETLQRFSASNATRY